MACLFLKLHDAVAGLFCAAPVGVIVGEIVCDVNYFHFD
jgi:ribonuclease PH